MILFFYIQEINNDKLHIENVKYWELLGEEVDTKHEPLNAALKDVCFFLLGLTVKCKYEKINLNLYCGYCQLTISQV